jgi:hypothetical protein
MRLRHVGGAGGQLRTKVGNHLIGRFCPATAAPNCRVTKGQPSK